MAVAAATTKLTIRAMNKNVVMAESLHPVTFCHKWQICRSPSTFCQSCATLSVVLTNVAVIALDGVAPFELGVLCESFGVDRSDQGIPRLDFAICALSAGLVRTSMGFSITVEHGIERLAEADLVAVPAATRDLAYPEEVLAALAAAVDRGARVMSVCTGAFVLAAAGLLDGRRCTTHWLYADELAQRYPLAKVDPNVLYVDDDSVVTSAGSAAGLDASLHLWRTEYGATTAATVARRMVVPPHRDGGQAQFVEAPIRATNASTLSGVLDYMAAHLHEELTVESLSQLANMSPRTFARRFRAETGTTPYDWLLARRVSAAQRLLEEGDDPVEAVAARSGFGTAAVMRHHFGKRLDTTPQGYRAAFRARAN
jgi:transcriptional regulator GlxA family with amidase domain